jgi:hypothetical protein
VAIALRRLLPIVVGSLIPCAAWYAVSAAELVDGTPVPVRLVGVINSETTTPGQPLVFVVTQDITAVDGRVLIKRGAPVAGVVTRARRAHWGFIRDKPRLEFRFKLLTARDGQVVVLRAAAERGGKDRVVVDRYQQHHEIRWATGSDAFRAYVDGTYEF